MLTEERYIKILELINKNRTVSLTDLVQNIGVSESTLRRDLTELDRKGALKKIRGGAARIKDPFLNFEPNTSQKIRLYLEEKRAIAKYAAMQISDDDIVYLDAGTTTERLVDELSPDLKAMFVTNGIVHARKLIRKGLSAYILGGRVKSVTEAVIGAKAVSDLSMYNFTKCFMGTNGIAVNEGYTTPDPEEAAVKAEAVKRSYVSYILADHSKFNKVYACTVADLKSSCIVTDRLPDNKFKAETIIKEVLQ